jgi:uncharacterized protein
VKPVTQSRTSRSEAATEAEGQAAAVAFLSDPANYHAGVERVDIVETHISRVFLAGERAYKLKRAVKLP